MTEPLKPGDRVYQMAGMKKCVGTVKKVGLGLKGGFVEVELDPNPAFPTGMPLIVGGLAWNWLRIPKPTL